MVIGGMVLGHGEGEGSDQFPLQTPTDSFVLSIELVDDDQISDLHDSLLRSLKPITAARWHDVDHEIDHVVNLDL